MRLAQGFGLGGEWGGAVLMAVEHAPANRRGFYGSWPQLGAYIGLLLSTLVFRAVSRMPDSAFLTWGWRVPFLLSFILVVVGIWIRMKVAESPVFEKLKEQKQEAKMPIIEAITKHPKNILIAMGARFAENGLFYVFTVFSLTYIATHLKMHAHHRPQRPAGAASFIAHLRRPVWGALSDRFGRRPVYMWGAIACGILAFPFFWMLGTKDPGDHHPGHRHPGGPGPRRDVWSAGQLPLRDVLGPGALQRRLPGLPAGLHLRRRPVARWSPPGCWPTARARPIYVAWYMILPGGDHRGAVALRQGDPSNGLHADHRSIRKEPLA